MTAPPGSVPNDGADNGTHSAKPAESEAPGQPDRSNRPGRTEEATSGDGGLPDGADEGRVTVEFEEARSVQMVVNQYRGPVHAGSFNAGFAEPLVGNRRTGPLRASEIDAALDGYVTPECFQSALDLLEERRLLVVTGPEGAGKRAGALALLRERVTSGQIVGISPIVSAGDLALYKYRNGNGYLVQDRLPDAGHSAQLVFDLQAVARTLAERDAYMVVTVPTVSVPGAWRDFAVRWKYPDSAVLLDECLERVELNTNEQGRDRLLALAREHPSPAQIVEMVRRVRDRDGDLEAALESTVAADRDQLAAWFKGPPGPTERQVLFLAALCFVHGVPERLFDGAVGALEERYAQAAARGRPERLARQPAVGVTEDVAGDLSGDRPIPQTRGSLLVGSPIEVIRDAGPAPEVALPERRVFFKVSTSRGLVMETLWDLYGRELWDPLTDWIRDVARFGAAEAREQIALGVVLLGGLAGQGMFKSFLEPWARGYRRERLTAAYALWWSCLDDTFAPLALKTALTWSRQSSPTYQVTAVTAFSGQLGILYPGEAMQALWRLLQRGDDVSLVACRAFPELFGALTYATGNGGAVLKFLRNRGVELTGAQYELHALRRLVATVHWVLAARMVSTGELAAVTTLQAAPDQDDQMVTAGWLWAELLRFRPLRGDAIELLEQTLRALSQGPDGDRLIRWLGDAIAVPLSPRELALLRRDLEAAFLHATGDGTDHTGAFVSALLDALRKRGARPRP